MSLLQTNILFKVSIVVIFIVFNANLSLNNNMTNILLVHVGK